MATIGSMVISIIGDNKQFNKALDAAQKGIKGFNKNIDKISKGFVDVGKSATKYLTLPIVGALAAIGGVVGISVKMAADLEEVMRNVNTVMGVSEDELAKYTDQILDLSKQLPQSAKVLAEGLYDVAGSGFTGADAMKVLDASARAASAGVTTTEVATKGVLAVLNAYAFTADDAAYVSDAMFACVDKGVISFEQLAGCVGDVVSTAKVASVDFSELAGFIAYLTLKGISGAEATTMLNRQIMSIIDPSEKMAKLLKESGYETGELALKELGLLGIMELVNDETGGSITKLQELFPEVRAMKGASAELGAGFGPLSEFMGEFADVTGTTTDALEEQSKGFKFQLQVLKNNFAVAGIEIGNKFLPILTELVKDIKAYVIPMLGELAEYFEPIIEQVVEFIPVLTGLVATYIPKIVDKIGEWVNWFMNLESIWKKVILAAVGFLAAFGPVMLIIGKLIAIFKIAGVVIGAIFSPITLIIAAIIALIAAGVLIWKNWDKIKAKAIEIWGTIKDFLINLWESIKTKVTEIWDSIRDFFVNLWEGIKQIFQDAWEWIKNLFYEYTPLGIIIANWDEIVGWFSEMWKKIKTAFISALKIIWKWMLDWIPFLNIIVENWDKIAKFFKDIWNKIKNIFITIFNKIKKFLVDTFNKIKSKTITIWNSIRDFFKNIWNTIYGFFKSKIDAIRNYITSRFETIKNKIINIWNSIKNFFASIWESIKTIFMARLNSIKNLISTVFNFVKNSVIIPIWNSIKNFFSNIWNSIIAKVNTFKNSFLKVWDKIKSGVKSRINSIIKTINSLLSRVESGINSMIGKLSKIIPGIGKLKVSIPKIPELALGGTITKPGFVDVGERGRERIFLPEGAEVRPLEKITTTHQAIHIHNEYNEELASKTFARLFAQYVGVINK